MKRERERRKKLFFGSKINEHRILCRSRFPANCNPSESEKRKKKKERMTGKVEGGRKGFATVQQERSLVLIKGGRKLSTNLATELKYIKKINP